MYHIFYLLMDSYFLASKKIEAHLLTSIFHSEYSNPAKKTPSCKLLGRQQLGMQAAVLDYNSTAKISGAVLDYNSTAEISGAVLDHKSTAKISGSSQSHQSFSGS